MLLSALSRMGMDNIQGLKILHYTAATLIHQSTDDVTLAEKIITESLPYETLISYRNLRMEESTRSTLMNDQSRENLRHWEALFHTDPAQTKPFTAPGGFRGTAISPTFMYLQLTEHFGPLGIGWGFEKPDFQVVSDENGGKIVNCSVECWYKDAETRCSLWGVGGDRIVKKDARGIFTDDDAFKKALTDAIGNAFSRLGAGSDVRLGLFNDNKYIAQTKAAFRNSKSEYLPATGNQDGASTGAGGAKSIFSGRPSVINGPPPLLKTED